MWQAGDSDLRRHAAVLGLGPYKSVSSLSSAPPAYLLKRRRLAMAGGGGGGGSQWPEEEESPPRKWATPSGQTCLKYFGTQIKNMAAGT